MTFLEQKMNVVNYLAECARFAQEHGFGGYTGTIDELRATVEKDNLTILTVGEARRGKSLLLAAFLEDEGIFPVNVEVTTCLASVVRYAATERVTVTFEDGSKKKISRAEIPDFATESLNAKNKKMARAITVETPNPKLKDGVVFVDTPGVGSLNPSHTLVTNSFLPEADIVLFVSDATAELTQPELQFLQNVKRHCENFLFVLTKIDLVGDYPDVIERNTQLIEQRCGIPRAAVQYIPVSSRNRLDGLRDKDDYLYGEASNFDNLVNAIWTTVEEKRADIILAPPLGNLETVLKNIAKEIHIRETGLSGTSDEIAEMTARLRDLQSQRQELQADNAQWRNELQYKINKVGTKRLNRFNTFVNEATALMNSLIEMDEYLKNPPRIANAIEEKAQVTANEVDSLVYDELFNIELEFQKNHGLGLYDSAVRGELSDAVPEANINIQRALKPSKMRNVLQTVVNVLTFPLSTMIRELTNKGWDKLDEKRKAYRELEEFGPKHIPQIKAEISKYITMCVSTWRGEHNEYMIEVQYRFVSNLDKAIRQSKEAIDRDLEDLNVLIRKDAETKAKEAQKVAAVKNAFTSLAAKLRNVRPVASAPRPIAAPTGIASYSHLEE